MRGPKPRSICDKTQIERHFSKGPGSETWLAARLSVLDLRGGLVRRLTPDSEIRWSWDGRDALGERAAAGRYVLCLSRGTDIEAKAFQFQPSGK